MTPSTPKLGTTDHVPTILGENPLARPTAAAFDLPVGATLGEFEVLGPLGAGGMATVFKAKDRNLGREVALKILPPALAAEPDAVTRFKFEARAAAKLNHDHVARVFSFGEDRGLHYIAFEYVDGLTLRDLIDRHGPVPPPDAVRYMLDTAVGLQHAAERGVVHRDVKPSNIIITPAGRAKLIDMGLARSVDPHSVNGQVTQSGMTLGTFDYISPEQAIDPRRADVRSDIYSLGCTFYHALTGRTPVPDGNAARKLAAHQTEAPTDPRLINPAIPDELALVLDRMMAKLPAHRQQTAAALIADLNRAAAAMGMSSVPSVPATHPSTQPPSPRDRNWVALASLALAVLALSVAVVVLVVANSGSQSASLPPSPWNDSPQRPTPPTEPLTVDQYPVRVPTQATVTNSTELAKALKDNVPKITFAAGEYDLTAEPGAVLSGKAVEWDSPDGRAVVRVSASPRGEKATDPRPGSLTFLKCESVKLKGLRFEVSHAEGPKGVGVLFSDVTAVDVAECRFVVPSSAATDGAVLAFSRTGILTVRHGFFLSKALAAVDLSGGVKADFTECGFIAGRAAVDVSVGDGGAVVGTSHVTFLLNNSAAAVNVHKGAKCDLTAGHTLFAAPTPNEPGMMTELDRKAGVIRSADSPDVNTFTIPDGAPTAVYLADPPVGGSSASVLPTTPWVSAPKFDADNPFTALELNAKLPLLRVGDGKRDILGVRQWNDRRKVYTDWPLAPLVRANEVVWFPKMDPADKATYPDNVYADLRDALNALKGKGTLLVRGRGSVLVPSVVLDTGTKSITMKPDEDSAPILTPAPGGDRRETTLFRLEAGELKLEGLQFNMKPGKSADGAAVVSMSGGKRCELKRCVVTLDEGSDKHAAVVSLADVGKVMVKEFTDQPTVTLDTCLIRGRGRVVRTEAAVSATVSLTHVGVVTEGAPAFDFGPATRSVNMTLNLSHVTAALAGPLLDLRGGRRSDDKPMVKLDLQVADCLFAAQDKTAEPFVRVTALDPTTADRPLAWSSAGGNVFDGWTTYAEVLPDDTATPKKWDAAEWRKWSGEPEAVAVGLKMPPVSKAAAKPADLDPADTTTAGANLKTLAGLFPE